MKINCDNGVKVANNRPGSQSGNWKINVLTDGTYKVQLSRCPFHLNRQLTIQGSSEIIGGDKLIVGKVLPIVAAQLSVDDNHVVSTNASSNATYSELTIELTKGEYFLNGWFEDANKNRLCGAFYGRIQNLN